MYIMKIRLLCAIAALVLAVCCLSCSKETPGPSYIVQVSLGGWNRAEYTAEQVIARLDTVSRTIPVGKVIMGWSKDREIYRQVGDFLHGRGIELFLWLPVFAETEEVCENTPAVDLWGPVPFRDGVSGVRDGRCVPGFPTGGDGILRLRHGFDGAVLSWNIMEAPEAHVVCLGER